MIHFDASRAKHQTTERNRYSLLAWINLLYYLTCPNTDLLGIIPSRFGGKINFLGGLPVYFSSNKLVYLANQKNCIFFILLTGSDNQFRNPEFSQLILTNQNGFDEKKQQVNKANNLLLLVKCEYSRTLEFRINDLFVYSGHFVIQEGRGDIVFLF